MRRQVSAHPPPPQTGLISPTNTVAMIIHVYLDLKQIARSASRYPWPRPKRCPCGSHRLWGHGFVDKLFEGFCTALKMRRYRCPCCGGTIGLRPAGYFPRHQSDQESIRTALAHRIGKGRWPRGCVTNRARHWLSALRRNVLAVLGVPALSDLLSGFDQLVKLGRVPVSRAE